MKLGMNSMPI